MLEIIAQTSMYQEILGRGVQQGREEEIRKMLLKQ